MKEYKGYSANIEYNSEAEIFLGKVLGTRDVVTFQGHSIEELKQAFKDSVDNYLELCLYLEEDPEKHFSGKFVVRISPDLHRNIFYAAKQSGKSLNAWIADIFTQKVVSLS
ncbi:MAG: type II toxin-antitoxin system HicB family antitoxin [Candidatus Pacebacteria bacterium]|nr:type II toxin-antitoxin system HicB family antitoxin [Candidatus Paceibacterota bacterium]